MTYRDLGGWEIVEIELTYLPDNSDHLQEHLVPKNDLRQHELNPDCWCQPYEYDFECWSHNSADGREKYEQGAKLN